MILKDRIKPGTNGASKFGWHFYSEFDECETKGAFHQIFPHPDGGEGLEPVEKSSALLVGIEAHRGIEIWYASGWKDGQYKLDEALDAVAEQHREHSGEYRYEKDAADGLGTSLAVLTRYHNFYGPDSPVPEYPEIQVAASAEGEPLLEQNLEMPLNNGATFTGRLDGVMWYRGKLCPHEFKTSVVSWANRTADRLAVDPQCIGQRCLLKHNFPDLPIGPVIASVGVKNPGEKKSTVPHVVRKFHGHSEGTMEKFQRDLARRAKRLSALVTGFDDQLDNGNSPWDALDETFDRTPTGDRCIGNFSCDYLPICSLWTQGADEKLLTTAVRQGYRARSLV